MRPSFCLIAAVLLSSAVARAEDSELAAVADAAMGGALAGGSDFEGGAVLGTSLLFRSDWLETGAVLDLAAMSASRVGAGLVGGVAWRWRGLGGDLLAEAGQAWYQGVGSGYLSAEARRVDYATPYLGVRLGGNIRLPVYTTAGGIAGFWLWCRRDVMGARRVTNARHLDPGEVAVSRAIGGSTEVGLSLRLGLDVRG